MYQRKYMDFLLEHYESLNMPYPFPISFNFIASPLLMEKSAVILCLDDDGEAVGAFSYIRGTGESNYENHDVLQVQVAYLVEALRGTVAFLHGLQFLSDYLEEEAGEVTELVFWSSPDAYLARLFGKFAERTSVQGTAAGDLFAYRATPGQLKAYLARFGSKVPGGMKARP
ncbi:MAG: hypothetical protein K0Q63_693, partial [Paenibacillus sp.]|nr:hypothetical protein [Paenibacillus sp.]